MADGTLYLFDGFNLLHAGPYDDPVDLANMLASYIAGLGARGVLVFDGVGDDAELGPLRIRFAPDADALLERLAAEHRDSSAVVLVSSDREVRGTAGSAVAPVSSATFFKELKLPSQAGERPAGLGSKLDDETLERLERLRRGVSRGE